VEKAMKIQFDGSDQHAAGIAALALMAAMLQQVDEEKRGELAKIAETMLADAPSQQPTNGNLRARVIALIRETR
jgi:hypothetical protein